MQRVHSRESDSRNDGKQGDELHHREAGPEEDGGDQDGEQWSGRADDLVELQSRVSATCQRSVYLAREKSKWG